MFYELPGRTSGNGGFGGNGGKDGSGVGSRFGIPRFGNVPGQSDEPKGSENGQDCYHDDHLRERESSEMDTLPLRRIYGGVSHVCLHHSK